MTADPMADFARRLFKRALEDDVTRDLKPANQVAREGSNPNPASADEEMRAFAAALFNTTD